MPLHGRVPATIFPVMNGGWPYGHGGFRPQHPRQGISNPLDPDYRVPGAALGGDQNAPLSFTYAVHRATARNILPCAGPLHPRLARSLRENRRRPRRPGRPSSPPPPPAQAAGLPFPRTSSSTVRGPVRGTGPHFSRITGLRERVAGRRGNPSPSGRVPDMDFAGPSVPAWIGPTGPGVSIRAAGEFAIWIAKRECPRKLERRGPPGNDDSGPLVL